ncbi:MAG: sugar transferase [Phycisphaeraceae bacterium]
MTMTAWDATTPGAVEALEAPRRPVAETVPAERPATARDAAAQASPRRARSISRRTMRALELACALGLGVVTLPLVALIALAIRLESRGPIFFVQQRPGLHGRPFFIIKFRTMYADQCAAARRFEKCRRDPRVTCIGRLLRRTSLDELPQLWNVIRGDLTLVGPRPYLYEQTEAIGRRLSTIQRVRPGLTGLWQVSGRSDLTLRRRIACDLYYVQNRSLALNLAILARTITAVLSARGAY